MDSGENKEGNGSGANEIGKSGSASDNGNGKPIQSTNGTPGYVDPDFQRKISGGKSTEGSISPGQPSGGQEPTARTASPGADTPKRGRGRPPGSGKRTEEKTETVSRNINVAGIEKILFSIHAIGAATLQIPELNITEDESKKLGKAIENVSDHYRMTLDPKTAAMVELVQVASVIYAPRGIALYLRKRNNKPKEVSPAPAPPQNQTVQTASPVFDPANIKVMH